MYMYSTFFQKLFLGIFLFLSASVFVYSQEYKYEIGGMAGGAFYMGDLNKTTPFKELRPAVGFVFRYNMNLRMALKTNVTWGMVSGSTSGMDNVFPDQAQASFSRSLFDLGAQYEFNFLPYSDIFGYKNTSRFSPYLLIGAGVTYAPGKSENSFGFNIPMGVGVKYKLKNRLNLGCEFSVRRLFTDDLDVTDGDNKWLDDPYQMSSSFMKNKDWYSFLVFSVTWDFGPRGGKCNNIHSF